MHFPRELMYGEKYTDNSFEYRNVHLPESMYAHVYKKLRQGQLLEENEWRFQLQIAQSEGWEHYDIHKPELNILLFRKRLDFIKNKQQQKQVVNVYQYLSKQQQ